MRPSPHANTPLSKSTPVPTLPAPNKASASLPNKEKMQEGWLLASQAATLAVKALHVSSPMETARIEQSDRDTGGRMNIEHTLLFASSIDPSSIYKVQVGNNVSLIGLSSVDNVQECLPHMLSKTNELSMARSLPTREPRLTVLARKAQVASQSCPYAGVRPKERKRCLTPTEFMSGGLNTDVKSLHCNRHLEAVVAS